MLKYCIWIVRKSSRKCLNIWMYVNHLASLHVFIIYFLMEKSSRFCSVTALRAYNTIIIMNRFFNLIDQKIKYLIEDCHWSISILHICVTHTITRENFDKWQHRHSHMSICDSASATSITTIIDLACRPATDFNFAWLASI